MVSRHAKTLSQIRRLNGGLHWTKVEALLRNLRAETYESRGSTVTFVLEGRKLTVDRPHARKSCGRGLVKRVRRYLVDTGHIVGEGESS